MHICGIFIGIWNVIGSHVMPCLPLPFPRPRLPIQPHQAPSTSRGTLWYVHISCAEYLYVLYKVQYEAPSPMPINTGANNTIGTYLDLNLFTHTTLALLFFLVNVGNLRDFSNLFDRFNLEIF